MFSLRLTSGPISKVVILSSLYLWKHREYREGVLIEQSENVSSSRAATAWFHPSGSAGVPVMLKALTFDRVAPVICVELRVVLVRSTLINKVSSKFERDKVESRKLVSNN